MADRSISELAQASAVTDTDLFVLQQGGVAKKLLGSTLLDFVTVQAVDGHGGIKKIEKTGESGTAGNGRVVSYAIVYADGTSFSFTITDGVKGDAGQITSVTAHTLAPGSQATAANTGTAEAARLDFGIPAGKTPAFYVNSVETLNSYEPADISFTYDDNQDAQFNFKIPRGKSGVYTGSTMPPEDEEAELWISPGELGLSAETWKFVLADGTVVEKDVFVGNA